MPPITKGSRTSNFPDTSPDFREQDESNDPAVTDPLFAEAKDYNIAAAEIESIANTLGLGGRGIVTIDNSAPDCDIDLLNYVYLGEEKNFTAVTNLSLTDGALNKIYIDVADNTAKVAVSYPSTPYIPLAEWDDSFDEEILTDERTHDLAVVNSQVGHNDYFGQLDKSSNTVLRLSGKNRTSKYMVVNGEEVSLSANLDCTVGSSADNLISTTGADSGSGPTVNNLFFAYVSNRQVDSALQKKLRLSTTGPNSIGYLNGTGNATNWRFVGCIYLTDVSSDPEITEDYHVFGIRQKHVDFVNLVSNSATTTGSAEFKTVQTLSNVVLLNGSTIDVVSQITQTDSTASANSMQLDIDSDTYQSENGIDSSVNAVTLAITGKLESGSDKDIDITTKHNYSGSGTLTAIGNASVRKTYIAITRESK